MSKEVVAVALMIWSASSFACEYSDERPTVAADLNTHQTVDPVVAWEALAYDMRAVDQAPHGQALYNHEGQVIIQATVSWLGIETHTVPYMMEKQCSQTLEAAAQAVAESMRQIQNAPADGSGNNGGGGPMYTPVITRGFTRWVFRCTVGGQPVLCSEYTDGN